jgi:hypothetical protein
MVKKKNDNHINVISTVPCRLAYSYGVINSPDIHSTCVEVFRDIYVFDFPSLPRTFNLFVIMDLKKGKYNLSMDIVDEEGNKLINKKSHTLEVLGEEQSLHFNYIFRNVVFKKRSTHTIRIFNNRKILYRFKFKVKKINRRIFEENERKKMYDDPETVKSVLIGLHHGCGNVKKFSLFLNPEEQPENEKLPENDIYICPTCNESINIAELKAHMKFFIGTKNIIDILNRNLMESSRLAVNGFPRPALILQISSLEAFLKDTFFSSYKRWFYHLYDDDKGEEENRLSIREKIFRITRTLNIHENFKDMILFGQSKQNSSVFEEIDQYNEILRELLFSTDMSDEVEYGRSKIINFQQIKKEGGFWAYRKFS